MTMIDEWGNKHPDCPGDRPDALTEYNKPLQKLAPVEAKDDPFENRWQMFLREVSDPSIFHPDHKALARLGFSWALQEFKSFSNRIYPK
jgi:hypothetical protein